MKRTHNNNQLTLANLKETVVLKGWVQKTRNLGGLLFIDLRDRFGITQLVSRPQGPTYETALKLKSEYVIEVQGIVLERESKNKHVPTGDIEIDLVELSILSTSDTPPMIVSNQTDALEETRLKYRYLDLRRPVMQSFLINRHHIVQSIRSTLVDDGFYELETPILGKSTPEGARDYLVPSRLYPGTFYALPQSPQIYKQLFMIAGFEKYFQVARCFRDEDLRADRQPEFTQIDIEASFVDEEDLYDITEKIMRDVFKKVLGLEIKTPFPRMTYKTAIETYGTDKPDTRYGLHLVDYTDQFKDYDIPLFAGKETIRGIKVDDQSIFTRKVIDELSAHVKKHHGDALATLKVNQGALSGSLQKFIGEMTPDALGLEEGNLLFLVPGTFDDVTQSLGALRTQLAEMLSLIDSNRFDFLWVTDWPLLEYDHDEQRFYARHHPFTAPDDPEVLKTSPIHAMAKAYDIVLNGYEIGGGSIRIHDQKTQSLMFETLGLKDEDVRSRFGFFVDALKYGTPPHGGIALGLDRIVMLMTKTDNIKDVIAFPKTQSAKDLMMQAPSDVDQKQLTELKIKAGE